MSGQASSVSDSGGQPPKPKKVKSDPSVSWRKQGMIPPKDWVAGEGEVKKSRKGVKLKVIRPENCWLRQPGESELSYGYFLYWMSLPFTERNSQAVADHFGISVQNILTHSAKWFWVERLREKQNHEERIKQKAIDSESAKQARKWTARREKALDQRYDRSQKLFEVAEKMIGFPLTAKSIKEKDAATGVPVKIEIRPVRWNLGSAVRFMQTASMLEASSIAESLEYINDFDPDEATPEECAEYLRKVKEIREKSQSDLAKAFGQ